MRIRRSQKLLFTTLIAFVFTLGTTEMIAQDDRVAKNAPPASEVSHPETGDASVDSTKSVSPFSNRASTTRVGVQSASPISLSLDDAIRKALANNNTIEITRDDVRYQETQIRSILGFYDPVFTIAPTFTRNSTTGAGTTRCRRPRHCATRT